MDPDRSISCWVCGYCLDGLEGLGAGAVCPECRASTAESVLRARDAAVALPRPEVARRGYATAALTDAGLAVVCVVFNLPGGAGRSAAFPWGLISTVGVLLVIVLLLVGVNARRTIAGAMPPGPVGSYARSVPLVSFAAMALLAAALVCEVVVLFDGRDAVRSVAEGVLLVAGCAGGCVLLAGTGLFHEMHPALIALRLRACLRWGMAVLCAPVVFMILHKVAIAVGVPGFASRGLSFVSAAWALVFAASDWSVWRALPRTR